MVTKTYTILFSTFWLLFILSLTDNNNEEAETIYQYVMIVSIVCGVAFVPIVGKLADRVSPTIMLPAATGCRFLAIVCFCFIKNPNGVYCYIISVWMVLGTLMETVCNDAVLFRNADREVRGVINGTAQAFGFAGQFIFSLVAGLMYDSLGPYAPFILVGGMDLTLCIATLVLGMLGVL